MTAAEIHPQLSPHGRQALQRSHVTIINTAYGKPFTVNGFSQWMRDAITAAGLPLSCQPHGLRKATGRRLAEAERYTREADQMHLATAAISKLEGQKVNRGSQTTLTEFGEKSKNDGGSML